MAVQLILQRAGGGTINLYNKNADTLSTVIRAEQKQSLLGEDIVNITVESAVKIPFAIGDKTTIFGRDYKINRLPKPKKTGNRLFTYDIELEGVQYDLMRATYDLNIDTTNNELQDVQADTLTGNLHRFATVLIANANRVFPGKWTLGEYPADTEDKTLTFGETDNCLSVLQQLCSEYNTEFDIEQVGGVNTINFGKAGQIFPYTFEYGKGKGLYELERQNVSSANIVTRLKVFGGTRNVSYKYRAARLCLPGKTKGQSFIEKTDAVNKYGIWEATKHFDNIYPSRTGTITGLVPGSVLKFIDNTMNFDLNEKEADGITTKYLLDGVAAKIHFNSGNLSGYEFELQSYDHATKTFTLKPFKDERDETFPSEKSEAFQFAAGDKYVILDIALPQTYIDEAEVRLAAEGNTYYDQNSQPKVQYSLVVAEEFLKSLSGVGGTTNIFQVGDYLPVKDTDIDVDKSVRIQGFTRNLIDEYKYQLTISDTVTTNITNRVISELIDIDKVIKINNLKDPAKARRDWRSAQELLDMIFDTEGDYYSEKIKPGSIETQMLSVGAKSTQFGLVGTVIQANYNGNKNSVNVKGGVLSHYTITDTGRFWNLADNTTTLTGDGTPYYIYAKCQRVGTAGSVIFSTEQIKVEQDPDFYHFFVGVVNSVDTGLNVRSVALTYGFTTVNGRYVRTGRIQSNDGTTYFDLDLGEIGGKITFASGGTQTDLSDWANDITGDIQDTQQAASQADQKAQQALDEAANIVVDFNAEIATLQQQIDGEVSNWFYPYSPTLANYPASDWTTNTIKDRHIGDTFTNTAQAPATDAGKSWRFVKNGTVYSWTQIADSDAVLALQKAAQAQATADGKSTTFLVQPSNYHLGDTWVLNADRTINGTAYKQGEILTATQDSTTFVEAHWIKRVRYTDDTAVNNLQIGGRNLVLNSENRIGFTSNNNSVYPIQDRAVSGENYRRFRRTYPEGITSTEINTYTTEFFTPEKSGYYTYSTYFRPNEFDIELRLRFGSTSYGKDTLCKAGEWTQVSCTTYIEAGVSTRLYGVYGSMPPESIQWIDYNRVSVTSGNKATDWTPALEDVDAKIADTKLYVEYSTDGTSWHTTFQANDVYMRQKTGVNGTWTEAIKIVGKDGTSVSIKGKVSTSASLPISASLGDGYIAEDTGHLWVWTGSWTDAGQIQGDNGANSYIHIAYADDSLGGGFSHNPSGKSWIGIYADFIAIDSDTPSDYTWMYAKGQQGEQGVSIYSITPKYAVSTDGVNPPISWSSTVPAKAWNEYMWQYEIIAYSDSTTFETAKRVVSGINGADGADGADGTDGADGISITNVTSEYAVSASSTTAPTVFSTTIPTRPAGQYLWVREKVTYSSGLPSYTAARVVTGDKGDTGASAPLLYLSASAQVMKCNPDNTPQTGQTISIEAKLQNVSGTATFVATPYNDAGTALTAITLGGSGNTRTLTNAQWLATYKKIEVVATLGSLTDKVTIYRVADGATGNAGQNAIVGLLTNESVTLQANNAGVVSSFTPANGEFWVYNGTTRVTTGITFSKVSNTGCTATINSSGAYSVSAMTADNATAIFRAVYNGVTIEKTLSLSKSKAGADGVSITGVDVEFAKNTSPTTAPTTGWTTTAPTLAEGEQLWTRTKTTYSSGNPTYSTPANITPKKGDTGAVGQGVESVTEEFAISSSKTTQPTSGWSTTQPTWSQGQYIWSRIKVVYKNPASTVYTGYAVSSEWEAVNELEIGGRNLIIRNSEQVGTWINTAGNIVSTANHSTTDYIKVEPNKTYSFSKIPSVLVPEGIGGYWRYAWYDENKVYISRTAETSLHNFQWTIPNNTHYVRLSYPVDSQPKFEKGTKVTDWTPAPEDVQAEIDAEKTRINDILSDNIADPSEKQYLSNLWQEIYAEYPRIWAQANDYSVSKTTYEQKYTALKNILDPVLANLTINSTVSGSSIRTAFSQYYDARTALQNAITNKVNQNADAAGAIAADAQAKANTSKAITDKFKTTINGGLINTVTMELREADTENVTAGISGIQNGGNGVAFWAGGTYAEAIAGTAKAIIRHDGTSKFTDGEFRGAITAVSGAIGGFEISSGRIGKAQSGNDPTNGGMSLYNEFIKFSNISASVFLGTNVLPSSSGITAMMRLTDNSAGWGSKFGIILDVSGASTLDGKNANIALSIPNGVVQGFRMQVRPINSTGGAYTFGDETVMVIYATATTHVNLPSNPQRGDIRYIICPNNYQILVIGSSSRQILPGRSTPVNSTTIGGGSATYPGSKIVIWDGSYWQLLSI